MVPNVEVLILKINILKKIDVQWSSPAYNKGDKFLNKLIVWIDWELANIYIHPLKSKQNSFITLKNSIIKLSDNLIK